MILTPKDSTNFNHSKHISSIRIRADAPLSFSHVFSFNSTTTPVRWAPEEKARKRQSKIPMLVQSSGSNLGDSAPTSVLSTIITQKSPRCLLHDKAHIKLVECLQEYQDLSKKHPQRLCDEESVRHTHSGAFSPQNYQGHPQLQGQARRKILTQCSILEGIMGQKRGSSRKADEA